jgi:ribosomal protein S18 acetylase RimI-like enzyme
MGFDLALYVQQIADDTAANLVELPTRQLIGTPTVDRSRCGRPNQRMPLNASADIVLRDASPSDISALAELHVRTFREAHGGGPNVALREQQWRSKFAEGRLVFCVLLADASGRVIGFASGARHQDEPRNYAGELDKIYLLREYQGRGLGRRLLCAAATRFLENGITSMLLFGDARSRSNGFYEALGAERLYAATGEFHGGYGWRDLAKLASLCIETKEPAVRRDPGEG